MSASRVITETASPLFPLPSREVMERVYLAGFGGGIWRKRLLIDLERSSSKSLNESSF